MGFWGVPEMLPTPPWGWCKELIGAWVKVPAGTSAERVLAAQGQALECRALQPQAQGLITQRALAAKVFNVHGPTDL